MYFSNLLDLIGQYRALQFLTLWFFVPLVCLVQYAKLILVITITAVMMPLLYLRVAGSEKAAITMVRAFRNIIRRKGPPRL